MKMPFGKYQGTDINKIPVWYLTWCQQNLQLEPDVKNAIDKKLGKKLSDKDLIEHLQTKVKHLEQQLKDLRQGCVSQPDNSSAPKLRVVNDDKTNPEVDAFAAALFGEDDGFEVL